MKKNAVALWRMLREEADVVQLRGEWAAAAEDAVAVVVAAAVVALDSVGVLRK